jgi:hypothetical protein
MTPSPVSPSRRSKFYLPCASWLTRASCNPDDRIVEQYVARRPAYPHSDGGHQSWFGPPDEALTFSAAIIPKLKGRKLRGFAKYSKCSERGRERSSNGLSAIGQIRHPKVPVALRRISRLASSWKNDLARMGRSRSLKRSPAGHKVSALGQFFALSARNLKVLMRDRAALLLILMHLFAASLDLVFSNRNMYDP